MFSIIIDGNSLYAEGCSFNMYILVNIYSFGIVNPLAQRQPLHRQS